MFRTFVRSLCALLVVVIVCPVEARSEDRGGPQPATASNAAAADGPEQPQSAAPADPDSATNARGAAVADLDNDGRVDLYVSNYLDQVRSSSLQPLSEYWVGIDAVPPDDALRAQLELPEGQGLLVNQVVAGSAAEKAGVRQYDVLISCNDVPLKEIGDLAKIIEQKKESALTLRLVRGAKRITVDVTPQRRPASQTGATCPAVSKLDDQEFVRRAWLDLLGTAADPQDIQGFLNENRENKREWLVNRLLRNSTIATKSCTVCHASDPHGWKLFQSLVPHWDAVIFKHAEGAYGNYIKQIVGLPDEVFLQVGDAAAAEGAKGLPDGLSVSITYRKDEPAKIVVKQGEKVWEATAANYREKLLENLRGYVEALLPAAERGGAASQNHFEWKWNNLVPLNANVHWKLHNSAAQPQQPATAPQASPSESAFEKLDKQLESLGGQLGDLRKAMQELRQAMQPEKAKPAEEKK